MQTAAAIIVAAGRGTRLSGPVAKQFLPLGGRPILRRTLETFDGSPLIDTIWLVLAPENFSYCRRNVLGSSFGTSIQLVQGGAERQVSVYNALRAMPPNQEWVVVHDGVRPLVTADMIAAGLREAVQTGASVLAIPAYETVKRSDASGCIEATLEREKLWLVQTPQTFRYDLILKAHRQALRDGFQATDDAVLVERIGHPVKIVPGSRRNLKITTAEDLVMAEALIRKGLESDPDAAATAPSAGQRAQ
jgi:2-C-methyl-D-erythritol 4-phosphate cytidylyltransferase